MHYQEIAVNDKVTHNGKTYLRGDVVREDVVLNLQHARILNNTPKITGCKYVLKEEAPKETDVTRADLFAEITALGGKMPRNAKTAELIAKVEELKIQKDA